MSLPWLHGIEHEHFLHYEISDLEEAAFFAVLYGYVYSSNYMLPKITILMWAAVTFAGMFLGLRDKTSKEMIFYMNQNFSP